MVSLIGGCSMYSTWRHCSFSGEKRYSIFLILHFHTRHHQGPIRGSVHLLSLLSSHLVLLSCLSYRLIFCGNLLASKAKKTTLIKIFSKVSFDNNKNETILVVFKHCARFATESWYSKSSKTSTKNPMQQKLGKSILYDHWFLRYLSPNLHRDVFLPSTKNFLKAKACNCNVKPKFFGQGRGGKN